MSLHFIRSVEKRLVIQKSNVCQTVNKQRASARKTVILSKSYVRAVIHSYVYREIHPYGMKGFEIHSMREKVKDGA